MHCRYRLPILKERQPRRFRPCWFEAPESMCLVKRINRSVDEAWIASKLPATHCRSSHRAWMGSVAGGPRRKPARQKIRRWTLMTAAKAAAALALVSVPVKVFFACLPGRVSKWGSASRMRITGCCSVLMHLGFADTKSISFTLCPPPSLPATLLRMATCSARDVWLDCRDRRKDDS